MNSIRSKVLQRSQRLSVPSSCVVQTPDLLAYAMVKALGSGKCDSWLEPCVGKGMLLSALNSAGIASSKITGLDIDPRAQPNDKFGKILRGTEFLQWSNYTESRFDRIIANPPYIALERLNKSIRSAAAEVSRSADFEVGGNANAWYAFLCASIGLLKAKGSLCFLLPAAWDFANYAAPLRASIASHFNSVDIFRTATPIFRAANVQEGAILLLARGRRVRTGSGRGKIYRQEVHSVDDLVAVLSSLKKTKQQDQQKKFETVAPVILAQRDTQPLRDVLKIRLGVVTGDASYFLLTEQQRRDFGLTSAAVRPVLSKAKHLIAPYMDLDQWRLLKDAGERIWLFNPSKAVTSNWSVQSYIRFGRRGGCERENHKVALRKPWFRFANLPTGDAFISGMSNSMPWLCFRNAPNLWATNTLYVASFFDRSLNSIDRTGIALSLLTSSVREQMREKGRTYAAGLLKYEPTDLLALNIPKLGCVVGNQKVYKRAIEALIEGDEAQCTKIADSCIL